jgi:hypothetical protein
MKQIIFLLITLFSLNSFSQVLPDGGQVDNSEGFNSPSVLPSVGSQQSDYVHKATDLILFPNEKEVIASIEYFSTSVEYRWDYLSQEYSSTKVESTGLNYTAGYAFDEFWALGVTVEQLLTSKQKVTFGPATTSDGETSEYESEGFDDPSFLLVYRAMDVSRNRYDMNLTLKLSPKIQEAKGSTTNKKGNNAKGGTDHGIGVQWGRRDIGFSWAVGLDLDTYGEAKSKSAGSSGDVTTVDSYGTFSATGSFQWVVSPSVSLDLNLSLGSTGEIDVKYDDGSTLNYESASAFGIGGKANIKLQEKLYLTFDVMSVAIGDREVTDETGTTVTDTERGLGRFKVGLISQF